MLRIIGAGLPRTATNTPRMVLPTLTGGPCYHMVDVSEHPEHVAVWQAALDGNPPDWRAFLNEYTAAVDWPASAFWRELAEIFPDATILLSTRTDGETWWRSVDATIMDSFRSPDLDDDMRRLDIDLWRRTLGPSWDDPAENAVAYQRWVDDVRRTAPRERLVDWQAQQGWEQLCAALGVPVPDEPFPVTNSTAEWAERRRRKELEEAAQRDREV
jgi:Sulfotransferase domain